MLRIYLTSAALLLSLIPAFCQDWKALNADQLFALAREEAFAGDREKAREKLRFILASKPGYEDVRILLARTYAWDGKRDSARTELQIVLDKSPKYQDAISALIDVEKWDEQHEAALKVVNTGLKYYPTSSDFMYKKAEILNTLERKEEAMATINQLLGVDPTNERALQLRSSLKTGTLRYDATFRTTLDLFSRTFDPAFNGFLQLSRNNDWGSSILRANYSNRFNTSGFQGEIDLYPKIARGVYGYINYGYSQSSLFPEHRIGAEVFSRLPKSFEGSVGLRYLAFDSDITIFTGSVGWYYKSVWLSFRPFVTPDKRTGTSMSGSLTLRRYFGNPNNYLELSGGLGFSPDIRTIQTNEGLSQDEIYILNSQRAGAGVNYQLKYNWLITAGVDVTRQELAFDIDNYVIITRMAAGMTWRF